MANIDFDMIVDGAGISGINAGYRVHSEMPNAKHAILEARDSIGGTWDLFKANRGTGYCSDGALGDMSSTRSYSSKS